MLQVIKDGSRPSIGDGTQPPSVLIAETLNSALGIARRQLPLFVIITACSLAFGLFYLFTTSPTYKATATMVIDSRKVQLFQQQSILGDIAVDAGTVLTQIEVLKSANVSQSVIKSLHLTDDPEFVGGKSGFIGAVAASVSKLFGGGETPSESQLKRHALEVFDKDRTVDRVGLTYVMDISFESHDPAKAARIANAIVDAYILDQLEAKYQATRRASVWLQTRIKQLRTQASSAQRAVVNFKQDHNIVDTGGQLMNEQEMAEVNSQLTLAHAATAEAKARLDNINQIMKQPIPDGSVADALNSQVIIALRAKYLELAAREAIWAKKYGPNHLAVLSLRNQMLELRKNISDEMKKIAEAYQNNYDVAMARENSIKSRLDMTVAQSQVTDQAKIQLRELQSSADSYQTMYDNFLQRYMEAVQQESFPITEARLISAALPPLARNHPKTIVVLPLTLIAGLMLSRLRTRNDGSRFSDRRRNRKQIAGQLSRDDARDPVGRSGAASELVIEDYDAFSIYCLGAI